MAPLTGEEIFKMVIDLQTKAQEANGKLNDLALPDFMYEDLRQYVIEHTKQYVDPEAKGFELNGTRIHFGELD